jgi:hypothetical protein
VHPLSSSPDLVAAPVESVVESGRVVLVAHLLRVKHRSALMCTAHATVRRNQHASEAEPADGRAAKTVTPE